MKYNEFLETKSYFDKPSGFEPKKTNDKLYDFQRDSVKWAIRKGRSTLAFAPGLGKTPCQLEWIQQCIENTNKPGLIFAPLAVSKQTAREAEKFGYPKANICNDMKDAKKGINITNYEKMEKFDFSAFPQIVLDESGILKHSTSKTRNWFTKQLTGTQYKLMCSATPCPNDYTEIGNHAEALGVMKLKEMLSMFFVHDGGDVSKWRLRGYAKDEKFWQWLSSWMIMMQLPSDLGYDDKRFVLPKLNKEFVVVKTKHDWTKDGFYTTGKKALNERRKARRNTIKERTIEAKRIIDENPDENWLIWCGLNAEGTELAKELDAVEVAGRHSDRHKEETAIAFQKGQIKRLVSKPSIFGYGLNFQKHCNNQIFVGLSDSWEELYQAERRIWRFGQKKDVNSFIVISDQESCVLENIKRKEEQTIEMFNKIIENTKDITSKNLDKTKKTETLYNPIFKMVLPNFI